MPGARIFEIYPKWSNYISQAEYDEYVKNVKIQERFDKGELDGCPENAEVHRSKLIPIQQEKIVTAA